MNRHLSAPDARDISRYPSGELQANSKEIICGRCFKPFRRLAGFTRHLCNPSASGNIFPVTYQRLEYNTPPTNGCAVSLKRLGKHNEVHAAPAKRRKLVGTRVQPAIVSQTSSTVALEKHQDFECGDRGSNFVDEVNAMLSSFSQEVVDQDNGRLLNDSMKPQQTSESSLQIQDNSTIYRAHPVLSSSLGDDQSTLMIQELQAKNAVLQKQLQGSGIRRKLRCSICDKRYSRKDTLHTHIRRCQDDDKGHRGLADKLRETRCAVCGKDQKRSDQLVKHEKRAHALDYSSRSEIDVTSLPTAITLRVEATKEHQNPPHITSNRLVPQTIGTSVLHTVCSENAVSPANIVPASSTSGFHMMMADVSPELREHSSFIGGCPAELGNLNSSPTNIQGYGSCVNGFSTDVGGPWSFSSGTGGHGGFINGLSTELGGPDSFYSGTGGHGSFVNGLSTELEGPGSFSSGAGGHGGFANGFSTDVRGLYSFSSGTGGRGGVDNGFSTDVGGPWSFSSGTGANGGFVNGLSTELGELDSFSSGTGGHGGFINGFSTDVRGLYSFSSGTGRHGGFDNGVSTGQGP